MDRKGCVLWTVLHRRLTALLRVILMLLFPCLMASEADIQGRRTSLLNDSTECYELHLEQSKTKMSESSNQ